VRRAALAALAAVAMAAACAAPPRDPHVIVVGLANSPINLDPGIGLDETSQRVHQLVFSSLLGFGPDFRPVPELATRFETTDFQTYTATIPAGVHFQNGREMTSADVAYTFRRFLDPAFVSGRKGAYRDLAAVDIVDRYTVAFRLKTRSGSFPANLVNVGIVPEGTGPDASRHPIGSGPYRVVEFVPDDHVTLAPFAGYYRGAPANAGLVLKVVPDETMRGLELRKGDVDVVVNDLSPDLIQSLSHEPGLRVSTGPGLDYAYLGLNLRDPILADVRVRKAIGYAIDRHAIVEYLQRGLARETAEMIPETSWARADHVFQFTHDPDRARALLDEAGYRDPDGDGPAPRLHLTLKTSTSAAYRLQATVLQQQLGTVGIAVDVRSYEFATLFADVVSGNVQLYTMIFTGGSVADPDILRRVFHSSQVPPAGFNRAHYANPAVDRALDAASAALTDAERRADYIEAQQLIAEDAPMISLWARNNVVVSRADLAGVRVSPTGDFDFLRGVYRLPPENAVRADAAGRTARHTLQEP
jgi:peptide/nickel transport system substrate-binding protein